jgi:DNA-binding NarL/FixJ family response regulator
VVTDKARVVLADDHPQMRAHVREALEAGGFDVCGEAANAGQAVEMARSCRPDVILLDIHMPGNGIVAAREVSTQLPETAVVMLTQSRNDRDLFDALRAGASGYLQKDMDAERLPDALRGVLAGEAAIPRTLVAQILDEFRSPGIRRFSRKSKAAGRLTSREWEVMELLSEGESTDTVAERLFISPTTVRVHLSSVLRKLRVKDRQSAFNLLRER